MVTEHFEFAGWTDNLRLGPAREAYRNLAGIFKGRIAASS